MERILVIPDCQIKPGVPTEHLTWLGRYICDLRPTIIVNLGDFFDLPSLSSYDRGTASIEGKRVVDDIVCASNALNLIEAPIKQLQHAQRKYKKQVYTPRKVFLIGNHEQRLERHLNSNPELIGLLSYDSFKLKERGWEVYDYLEIVDIEGILFSHYFANPMSGRPYTGKSYGLLQRIGRSFVQGHRQELDFTCRELVSGERQIGIVAGAFYQHDEGYKGYQGNKHWRGVIVLNEAENGWADCMMISMGYLKRKYS